MAVSYSYIPVDYAWPVQVRCGKRIIHNIQQIIIIPIQTWFRVLLGIIMNLLDESEDLPLKNAIWVLPKSPPTK